MTESLFAALNQELADVVNRVRRSVVEVRDGRGGQGAGTIWHRDGLIITNAHVARRGPLQVALPDGRVFGAQLLARDKSRDLAALALERTDVEGLEVINPSRTRDLRSGQWVIAIGHPWGVHHAATGGILIGRSATGGELGWEGDWVVADLQLRPGNSGGPLVDTAGRLIGVNTVMTGPQVGMAVSADAVKAFLKETIGAVSEPAVV